MVREGFLRADPVRRYEPISVSQPVQNGRLKPKGFCVRGEGQIVGEPASRALLGYRVDICLYTCSISFKTIELILRKKLSLQHHKLWEPELWHMRVGI
jgi:hypothetical protein